jgi:hypothetical protein
MDNLKIINEFNLDFLSSLAIKYIIDSEDDYEKKEEYINLAIKTLENKLQKDTSTPPISLKNTEFYFINLDSRKDRLDHVTNELNKFNLKSKRFDAVSDLVSCKLHFNNKMSDGQKKCFMSHYNLIKNYKGSNILGIFEDDVILCEDFIERFDYIEKNFNLDWDVFFLSSFYHLNDDEKRWHSGGDFEKTNIKYIHKVYGSFCCHSYLINPKSIKKIVNLLETTLDLTNAIDHSFILIEPKLNCYSFTPGMTTQLPNESNTDGGQRDQSVFEKILGPHYYTNKLSDLNYDEYFSKY